MKIDTSHVCLNSFLFVAATDSDGARSSGLVTAAAAALVLHNLKSARLRLAAPPSAALRIPGRRARSACIALPPARYGSVPALRVGARLAPAATREGPFTEFRVRLALSEAEAAAGGAAAGAERQRRGRGRFKYWPRPRSDGAQQPELPVTIRRRMRYLRVRVTAGCGGVGHEFY